MLKLTFQLDFGWMGGFTCPTRGIRCAGRFIYVFIDLSLVIGVRKWGFVVPRLVVYTNRHLENNGGTVFW